MICLFIYNFTLKNARINITYEIYSTVQLMGNQDRKNSGIANMLEILNTEEARFEYRIDFLSERKTFIKDDTEVSSGVNRSRGDIVW